MNGDRCREVGRMIVALEGLDHSLQVCKGEGAPSKMRWTQVIAQGQPHPLGRNGLH